MRKNVSSKLATLRSTTSRNAFRQAGGSNVDNGNFAIALGAKDLSEGAIQSDPVRVNVANAMAGITETRQNPEFFEVLVCDPNGAISAEIENAEARRFFVSWLYKSRTRVVGTTTSLDGQPRTIYVPQETRTSTGTLIDLRNAVGDDGEFILLCHKAHVIFNFKKSDPFMIEDRYNRSVTGATQDWVPEVNIVNGFWATPSLQAELDAAIGNETDEAKKETKRLTVTWYKNMVDVRKDIKAKYGIELL